MTKERKHNRRHGHQRLHSLHVELAEGWKSHLLYTFMLPSLPPTPKTQERSAEMSPHHHTLRKLYRMLKTAAAAWAKPPRSTTCPLLSAIRSDHIIPNPLAGRTVSGAEGWKKRLSMRHKLLLTALNGLTCTWGQKSGTNWRCSHQLSEQKKLWTWKEKRGMLLFILILPRMKEAWLKTGLMIWTSNTFPLARVWKATS